MNQKKDYELFEQRRKENELFEQRRKQRKRRILIKQSLMRYSDSSFNAKEVAEVDALIEGYQELVNKNDNQYVINHNAIANIQNIFRSTEGPELKDPYEFIDMLSSRLLRRKFLELELVIAKAIYLSECKINFTHPTDPNRNKVFIQRAEELDEFIKYLGNIPDDLSHSFHKKLKKFIESLETLKNSLLIKSLLNGDDFLLSGTHDLSKNYITFKDLCRATGKKNPNSFYALTQNDKSLLELSNIKSKAATLISARKWYAKKGLNQYKSVEHNDLSDVLLRLLLHLPI